MKYIKHYVFTFLGLSILLCSSSVWAYTWILNQITSQINSNSSPRESLVQRYYSIEDLEQRVSKLSPNNSNLTTLSAIKSALRKRLDTEKKSYPLSSGTLDFIDSKRKNVTTRNIGLSNICAQRYQLVDDRSYAFNMPTALVLATLDMESSCGRSKPNNGDGVFQLVAKDYGTWTLSTGQWIMMMYDFAELVRGKHARYHSTNKFSIDNCSTKDTSLTWQSAPICLSYTNIDLDSLIKHWALYNGLSGAKILWDIQPAAPAYVYGRYTDTYSGSVKDGLIVRVLKSLRYGKSL